MLAPGGQSREDLYTNWLAWATINLGGNVKLAQAAADAAADSAFRGDGFNAATNAARAAWFATAQSDQALWRPSFRTLVLTNPFMWAPLVLLLVIAVGAFTRVSSVTLFALVLLPIALIIAIWQVGLDVLLSMGGTVAHGSLVNVIKSYPTRGGIPSYSAVYEFAFQGRRCTASHVYYVQDSIRQDVMVLFIPRFPTLATVLLELLNPEST